MVDDASIRQLLVDALAVSALRQVLEVAHAADVVVVPVKGVVLARWLYDALVERPYRDLDLLVCREAFPRLRDAVAARGWRIRHVSLEMGELEFEVDRLVVEVHGEFGRRDLTRLSNEEVIARARVDRDTFPFEVLGIDDVDHFLLLVANVTKKSYTYANLHQPADLERLLVRLEPRWDELVARARAASFETGVRSVAAWMAEERGSAVFARFVRALPRGRPRLLPTAVRLHRRLDGRRGKRLESASGLFGLALATLTPDDWSLRGRGLARVVWRGLYRRLGRDPG
jgi:hypothetical protein